MSELDEIVNLLLEGMNLEQLDESDLKTLQYHLKLLIYWERRMILIKLQQILGNARAEIEELILPRPTDGLDDYQFGVKLRNIHQRYER